MVKLDQNNNKNRNDNHNMFSLKSNFTPAGDQPSAIKELISGIKNKEKDQVLLGVTGSGKTFTVFGPDAADSPEACKLLVLYIYMCIRFMYLQYM